MHLCRQLGLILLGSSLTACATVEQKDATYEKGSFPETGVRTTASVGEVIVSEYDYLATEVARVRETVDGSFWTGRNSISAGSSLIGAMAGNKEVYCQPPGGQGSPCLHDANSDGLFDEAYTMNNMGMVSSASSINPVPYRVEDTTIQDGFKYELVYQGIDGDVARIAYREYTDNLARPAYRQDLSYTLNENSTSVTFRDVRLKVHSADNNAITYTVDSGF